MSSEPMTHTEMQLVAVWGPAVPLRDVCEPYFGLTYKEACRKASVHDLPVPTFRMRDSERSPVLIKASDLAVYIDKTSVEAEAAWQHSQV